MRWSVTRSTRPFRAFVVEPELYACTGAGHGDIFEAALMALIIQQPVDVDNYKKQNFPPSPEPFDLVTFPEAFLPTDRLLSALDFVARSGLQGCVHVGLRPSTMENRHLFNIDELWSFIDELRTLDYLKKPTSITSRLGCAINKQDIHSTSVACSPWTPTEIYASASIQSWCDQKKSLARWLKGTWRKQTC